MDYWCRSTTSSASPARDVVGQWTLWQLELDQVSLVYCLQPGVPCSSYVKDSHLLTRLTRPGHLLQSVSQDSVRTGAPSGFTYFLLSLVFHQNCPAFNSSDWIFRSSVTKVTHIIRLSVAIRPRRDIYQVITDTTIIMGSGDPENKDSCPRCGGKVFEAEKMTGK